MAVRIKWVVASLAVATLLFLFVRLERPAGFSGVYSKGSTIGAACAVRGIGEGVEQPRPFEDQVYYISCGGFLE